MTIGHESSPPGIGRNTGTQFKGDMVRDKMIAIVIAACGIVLILDPFLPNRKEIRRFVDLNLWEGLPQWLL